MNERLVCQTPDVRACWSMDACMHGCGWMQPKVIHSLSPRPMGAKEALHVDTEPLGDLVLMFDTVLILPEKVGYNRFTKLKP